MLLDIIVAQHLTLYDAYRYYFCMNKFAKLNRTFFVNALAESLLTQEEFAISIGSNTSYLSRLSSSSPSSCRCGKKFVRRVLAGFGGKYKFDDLFFWAK